MALSSLRLRRAVSLSSSFLKHRPFAAAAASYSPLPTLPPSVFLSPSPIGRWTPTICPHGVIQRLSFRTSAPLLDRRMGDGDERKINPDEILFEGCDYNHWLVTMEFPKDPAPTPEEMVETYVQTLAKVVGSVEEAKKRMYACSTTTYNGFQAVMTEEMSEKFRGLPGVVFILPDSYIDPINKEYGGDKYDNGVITPRPPPVQYGRQGRYGDRNRNYDRPRYDRQRDGVPMQQGNPSFDQKGFPQGDGRNLASQRYPGQDRQHYSQPGGGTFEQGERRENFPGGRDGYGRREPPPNYQRGFNQGQSGNFPSHERRDYSQGKQDNYPPYGQNFPQGQQAPSGSGYMQGMNSSNSGPPYGRNFPQEQQAPSGPGYIQGMNSSNNGSVWQDGSTYGQNYTGAPQQKYGQNFSGPGQGQSPPHIDQRDETQGEQRNYPLPTGTNQGRY